MIRAANLRQQEKKSSLSEEAQADLRRAANVRQQEKRSSLSEEQQAAVKPAKSVDNKKYYNKCKSAGKKKDRDAEEDARQAERYHRIQNWEERNEVARFAAWGDSSRVPPIQHPVDVGLRELSFGTSTGRVLLQPMVPAVPPATSPDAGADNLEAQLFGIAATPFTGRIGASESMTLLHAHEVKLYDIHEKLFSLGDGIRTCTVCGQRSPEVSPLQCDTCCFNPGRMAAGIETVPAKFSAENCVSLMPPPSDDPVVVAERIELAELMGELTMMERALIRPVTPWISICRLPLGQFAFKGHAIAMVNDVKTIAETLPRRVADSGVTLLVGPAGLDDALKNPEFVRTYRVRKAKVERTLVLLFRLHA